MERNWFLCKKGLEMARASIKTVRTYCWAVYFLYCGGVLVFQGEVLAKYNFGNTCALCPADTCVNLGTEDDCNGVECELVPAPPGYPDAANEANCRLLFRATSSESVILRNCVRQNQEGSGASFITCSENVMYNLGKREVECQESRYCRCVITQEGEQCQASTAALYKDMDDCDGGLHPMPVPSKEPEIW